MSITEERRARHLELRERMLQGDNGARWELAMEAVPLLIHLFMRKNRLQLRCGIEGGDLRAEAALMAYGAVPQWEPERGTLATFMSYYKHPLAAAVTRQSGAVSLKGRDYYERRTVVALRESGYQRLDDKDSGEMFQGLLGTTEQPELLAHDCRKLLRRSRLTAQEKQIVAMRCNGEGLKECGAAFGFTKERARQVESGALRKLRESAGVRCG